MVANVYFRFQILIMKVTYSDVLRRQAKSYAFGSIHLDALFFNVYTIITIRFCTCRLLLLASFQCFVIRCRYFRYLLPAMDSVVRTEKASFSGWLGLHLRITNIEFVCLWINSMGPGGSKVLNSSHPFPGFWSKKKKNSYFFL